MRKFNLFALSTLIVSFGCGGAVGAPSEDPTGTATQAATAYNTPGPQYDDAGNLLGSHDNPFLLIGTQKFADASHKDFWGIDSVGNYGTFHQPVTLFGTLQYKWLQCGTAGANC